MSASLEYVAIKQLCPSIMHTIIKRRAYIKECLTTVKQVFFSYTNGWILSGFLSLLALHLSGTPTGTSPLAFYSSTTVYIWDYVYINY